MNSLGNKAIMAKNIQRYMNSKGVSRNEICDALGIKYTTFTDWVKGNTYPRIDKIELMANYFGISKSDLVEEAFDRTNNLVDFKSRSKGVKIPVLGEVAAGIPIEAIEDIIDYEEISEDMAKRGEFFGLRINGDSMLPRICKGDVVIVRQQPVAETGDTVIVRINGDSATCKRLRKYADGALELISTNPSYEPMFFSKEEVLSKPVEIIGKVIENRQKFE